MGLKSGTYSLNSDSGKLSVYTYKEGLLSKIAHDLLIDVTDFKANVNVPEGGFSSGSLEIEFQVNSLKVDCAMKDGERRPETLKEKDIVDIEKDMFKKVLHPDQHPTGKFCSKEIKEKEGGYSVKGELELHGVKKPIEVDIETPNDSNLKGLFPVIQKDYGIKPYKAMLGTLKVKNEIKIGFDLNLS